MVDDGDGGIPRRKVKTASWVSDRGVITVSSPLRTTRIYRIGVPSIKPSTTIIDSGGEIFSFMRLVVVGDGSRGIFQETQRLVRIRLGIIIEP